jgi:hypothetical protein
MYQPVNSIQTLSQMGKVPLAFTGDALASLDRGNAADQSNLQDLFSQNDHMAAMRPMQEQQLSLGNQTTQASLPGIVAQSSMLGRKNSMEESTFNLDIKNKLKEAALKASEQDLKGIAQHAQQLMYSRNPAEVDEGKQLWMASQHMMEERQKHTWDMEKVKEHNAGMISARIAGKSGTGKGPRDFMTALDKIKKPSERHAFMTSEAARLHAQDPENPMIEILGAMIESNIPQVEAERQDAITRAAGGITKDGNGKWVPATPAPLSAPKSKPGSSPDNPIVLK